MTKRNNTDITLADPALTTELPMLSEAQFNQLAEIAGLTFDSSPDTLAALGAQELQRAEFSVLRAGAYFAKLKHATALSHGGDAGYHAALERVGVEPRQAQRAVQIASYVASLPADKARRIAHIPKTKILPLVNADPEMVAQLLEDGDLDGDQPLSLRQLCKLLSDAKRQKAQQKTTIERLEAEKLRLARERSRVLAEEDLPPFALEARQESIALTDTMGFALDNLQSVIETNLLADNKHPEALRWQPIAAGTAWHAMAAVHARIGLLMKRLNAHFGDDVTGTHLAHSLSPAEVALATAGRAGLLASHQAEVKRRDDTRENNRPGKAGRKRK